ncbi:MAG: hypothetical protein K9H16_09995, partial [Bacteroidales bacterium]|nr:hypothetical protein [Bacteroidales bacterium]
SKIPSKEKCSRGDCTSKPKTKIYESEIFSTKYKSSNLSGMMNRDLYLTTKVTCLQTHRKLKDINKR